MPRAYPNLPRQCRACGNPLTYQKYYCSIPCRDKFWTGTGNPHYKGGWIDADGYHQIRVDGMKIPEHRHVMQVHLGRELLPTEIVHHRNGDRLDNRIENLELCSDQAEHMHTHRRYFQSDTHRECSLCHLVLPIQKFSQNTRCNRCRGLLAKQRRA